MSAPRAQPVTVAVVGLGAAGGGIHLPALRRLGSARLIGAADPDHSTHARAGDLQVWPDWRQALAGRPDAVIVASPPTTHAEIAAAALASGISAYVEKPMAISRTDAAPLVQLAAGSGLVLQAGYAYRFHPLWRQVRRLLDRGALRPPLRCRGRFTARRDGEGWEAPIVDVSCHHLDLLSWLLSALPAEVLARPGGQLEAGWPDGSRLVGDYTVGPPVDRVDLDDGRVTVSVDRLRGFRLAVTGARLGSRPLPPPSLLRARLGRATWERSFDHALGAFVQAVAGGSQPEGVPGAGAAVAMVATGEAILGSLASGQPEPVLRAAAEGRR